MIGLEDFARPAPTAQLEHGQITAIDTTAARAEVMVRGSTLRSVPYTGTGYAVGDVVLIAFGPGSYVRITGRHGSAPASAAPMPEDIVTDSQPHTVPVPPAYIGSYRSGSWWSKIPTQGSWGWPREFGAAYYGTAAASIDADLTEPYSATVHLHRSHGGVYAAQTPTMHLLASGAPPPSGPVSLANATGPALARDAAGDWTLPKAWVEQLLTGTAGGLGVYVAADAPYMRFDPAISAAQFVLSITSQREVP